jgi:hypothetical protein
MKFAPRLLLCNDSVNTSQQQIMFFAWSMPRSYLEDNQLRVQLWSVNQRALEAEESPLLRYRETSSENIAEEQPL